MSDIVQLPSGEWVVKEGAAPPAAAKPQTRASAAQAGVPRSEAMRRADEALAPSSLPGILGTASNALHYVRENIARPLGQGISGGFTDRAAAAVQAGTRGVYNAVTHGDVGEIGKEYNTALDTEREINKRVADNHPLLNTAAEIGGAVAMPVGEGIGALKLASKGAKAIGATRAERVAAGAARKLEGAGVSAADSIGVVRPTIKGTAGRAALASANQGALNAVGHTDDLTDAPKVANNAVNGGLGGALVGGVLGSAVGVGKYASHIVQDANPKNAERSAITRIAKLLDANKTDPADVPALLAERQAAGAVDPRLGDIGRLSSQEANISRQPFVDGANDITETARARMEARRANFGPQVQRISGISDDALSRGDNIVAGRKAAGKNDYREGGVLDNPIEPTKELQVFLKDAPETTQAALRDGAKLSAEFGNKVADHIGPDEIFTHMPNLRTFDYVKRGFDGQIKTARRAGDDTKVALLQSQFTKLKDILAKNNPNDAEYQSILGAQRTEFQKEQALQAGRDTLKSLIAKPRELWRSIEKYTPEQDFEHRVGLIDAIVNTADRNPIEKMDRLLTDPNRAKVIEHAFGGKDQLTQFRKYLDAEKVGARTDAKSAGAQSITSEAQMAAGGDDADPLSSVAFEGARAYGFGGLIGGVGGVWRKLASLSHGQSNASQELIAQALLSKGEDIGARLKAFKGFRKQRAEGITRSAVKAAKGAQQPLTDYLGN